MRAFGADHLEGESAGEISLFCPTPKSWAARKARTLTSAEYPGTAVEWEGRIFEVLRADPVENGGIRYRLAPWEEGHAIRRMERYDAASETSHEEEWSGRRAGVRKRRISILLAPLAGLLPGTLQKEMESEFGAPALAMTISSALPLFAIGFLGLFEHLVGGMGGGLGLPGWLAPPFPIALYLFGESALRLASAVAQGEPMGSLPVVLAYEARRAAGYPKPKDGSQRASSTAERRALDRYDLLEPLLALLSREEQRLLAERFGFDPVRWGRITAAILLTIAGANVVTSLLNLAAGRTGGADVAWLLAGGFLCFEQIRRWKRFSAGEAAGSVLGILIRPLAKLLFAPSRRSAAP